MGIDKEEAIINIIENQLKQNSLIENIAQSGFEPKNYFTNEVVEPILELAGLKYSDQLHDHFCYSMNYFASREGNKKEFAKRIYKDLKAIKAAKDANIKDIDKMLQNLRSESPNFKSA